MIAGKKYSGLEVDIWSSGIILFAMICGYCNIQLYLKLKVYCKLLIVPFEDPDTGNLYKKILKGEFNIPSFISPDG